jgi:hypothetical protein
MNIDEILNDLRAQRDRLNAAIAALDGSGRGAAARGRRRISAEGRRRISEALKKRWAARRKTGKSAAA